VKSTFDRALAQTLGFEGGWSNHPGDRGGATHYGVTQRAYDAWRVTTGQERRSVEQITDAEVQALYLADYWLPCRCDDLPEPLALATFDMAVNSGVWNAKINLQRALGVKADGVIGPVTLASAAASDSSVLLRFLKKRAAFIQDVLYAHPSDVQFIEGWINRLLDQAWRGGAS
jgi:lysozyme family protein